ncbi:MAG: RNA polymerase sigma factor [Patescibacteria group bacterium]
MQDASDSLIERIRQGDREALGEMYDTFAPSLYRYISFRIAHTQDREDILSSVFLRVFESIAKGKMITNIRAFLYQSTRNAIIDYYRESSRSSSVIIEWNEELLQDEQSLTPLLHSEQLIDTAIQNRIIAKELGNLKEEYRELLSLRYIEDLEIDEIAAIMQKSHIAVRVTLHRALKALKKLVESTISANK